MVKLVAVVLSVRIRDMIVGAGERMDSLLRAAGLQTGRSHCLSLSLLLSQASASLKQRNIA